MDTFKVVIFAVLAFDALILFWGVVLMLCKGRRRLFSSTPTDPV